MIYPIVVYGDPVLRKPAETITPDYPGLEKLIADMFETMYNAHGVGLAAPQIGKSIRMFVVDGSPMDEKDLADFKKVFINPEILEESDEEWKFEEGCLSIPGIREGVERPEEIVLRYQDEHFKTHQGTFNGLKARIIQHEYDHIEGILFTDHLSAFKKSLLRGRLNAMSKGDADASYPVKFYSTRKR
jgi:peptide deformylase